MNNIVKIVPEGEPEGAARRAIGLQDTRYLKVEYI